jgi:hypothetical protein
MTFTTSSEADTTPPVILSVTSTAITASTATITWSTDELSDSMVKYGTTSGYYPYREYDARNVSYHSVDLTGLSADTTYYYVVISTDQSGNTAESFEYQFTTSSETPVHILTTITVSPSTVTLSIGSAQQFTATAYDQYGNTMAGVAIMWLTSPAGIGTVSPATVTTGAAGTANTTFTALKEGTTTLTAFSGVMLDSAVVTVTKYPKPTVSIYTDRTSYITGTRMYLGLDITNPADSAQAVGISIYLEQPTGGTFTLTDTAFTLPAGLDYSDPSFMTFTLPSLPAGTYTWHAILSDPATGAIISEDTAEWEFYPRLLGAQTAVITEMLEQTTVQMDFGIWLSS